MNSTSSDFVLAEGPGERKQVETNLKALKSRKGEFPHGVPFRKLVYPYLWAKRPEDTSTAEILKTIRNLSRGSEFYGANGLIKALTADPNPNMARYLAYRNTASSVVKL
jgi:hypothetical protein